MLLTNRDDGDIRKFIHQMNDDIVIARSECEEKNKIFRVYNYLKISTVFDI